MVVSLRRSLPRVVVQYLIFIVNDKIANTVIAFPVIIVYLYAFLANRFTPQKRNLYMCFAVKSSLFGN